MLAWQISLIPVEPIDPMPLPFILPEVLVVALLLGFVRFVWGGRSHPA